MSEEISEVEQLRMVASDRLVWLRLMEKAINDIDSVMLSLKRDITEISQQTKFAHVREQINNKLPPPGPYPPLRNFLNFSKGY